jgi:hypothetical protein
VKLDAYTVVFLRRPVDAPALPDDELAELQHRHAAFNLGMRDAGHALFAGPFLEQPDPALRGMTVYRTSLEETRRLAHEDPLVRAGRLELDIFTWLVPAGMLGDRPAYQVDDD